MERELLKQYMQSLRNGLSSELFILNFSLVFSVCIKSRIIHMEMASQTALHAPYKVNFILLFIYYVSSTFCLQ